MSGMSDEIEPVVFTSEAIVKILRGDGWSVNESGPTLHVRKEGDSTICVTSAFSRNLPGEPAKSVFLHIRDTLRSAGYQVEAHWAADYTSGWAKVTQPLA